MEAINSKHQKQVDKVIKLLKRYNSVNDLRDEQENNTLFEDIEDDREYRRLNKLCESHYDKFLVAMDELPKIEQQQIYKSKYY